MKFLSLNVQEAIITPPEEEPMCEDALEVALDEMKDQVLQDEVPRPDTEPGEADSTATGSESRELLSRGGSAPLQVDTDGDSEEEVTEVVAEV